MTKMFIRRNIPCHTAITFQLSASKMFALEAPIACIGNAPAYVFAVDLTTLSHAC